MNTTAIVTGAFLIGWIFPELLLIHGKGDRAVPTGINFIVGIGAALLAYGLRA